MDNVPGAILSGTAGAILSSREETRSGDESESETEENDSDDGNVSIEDVPVNDQDGKNEQAAEPNGNQNGDEDGDENSIDINDESTFPPYVQFQRLLNDCLVKWTKADRDAVCNIWTLYERNTLPHTRSLLEQLKLTKTLVDLRSRF